nr:hypothetical protein [Thermococcus sp.]
MRFEALSRDDMNTLSRELSRAGIMNRTLEEVVPEVSHYVTVKGAFSELLEKADGIEPLEENLSSIGEFYRSLMEGWEIGAERDLNTLLDESDAEGLAVVAALLSAGAVEEDDGRLTLLERPPLEGLNFELRFPVEEIEGYLEAVEERLGVGMVTEYTLSKRYYVEALEVDGELIDSALEIAEDYATEESIVEATFDGIARSVLAHVILELAEKHRRKNELIKALMEREPITVGDGDERVNIYYDEDAIEDFLRTLQTLGYLKVKGNRIWV